MCIKLFNFSTFLPVSAVVGKWIKASLLSTTNANNWENVWCNVLLQHVQGHTQTFPDWLHNKIYAFLLLVVFVSFRVVPFQVYAMGLIFLPLLEAPPQLTFRIMCRTFLDSSRMLGTFWTQCPCNCYCIFVNKEITVGQIRWKRRLWATAMLFVAKNCCIYWAVCTGILSCLINHPQFCCRSWRF